jgi:serine protease Do
MAIGSPFGRQTNTVTAELASAKQRDTGDYLSFIQTDVADQSGNGKRSVNLRERLRHRQIYSLPGGFQGIYLRSDG